LQFREQLGINIAFIRRGEVMINIPSRNERLFPGDEICVIGTDAQLKEFKKHLDQHEAEPSPNKVSSTIVLEQLELTNEAFIGKSIRESQLREKPGACGGH
jgi:CPA2 family monovalent cation:H+ antiporter-2